MRGAASVTARRCSESRRPRRNPVPGTAGPDRADGVKLPLIAWGDTRRIAQARCRRRRRRIGALAALGLAVMALPLALRSPPLLVWNASPSMPVGLYSVHPGAPAALGDTVVVRLPPAARALAARRHYLPWRVPAVKRVAASAGARVCARGDAILIGGARVARRLAADRLGRPLPWWRGCRTLSSGEIFLLVAESPESFDGRYFGPSPRVAMIGPAHLLWSPSSLGAPRD